MKTYPINEIFYSLQGEGVYAGFPAIFVRFSGCNLDCPWCDAPHESSVEKLTSKEILERINLLIPNCWTEGVVILTGGEPAIHVDASLMKGLKPHFEIHMETNGTIDLSKSILERIDWLTVSPKYGNKLAIRSCNELKVVFDGKVNPNHWKQTMQALAYSIQPLSGNFQPAVDYVLAHPEWRLSIQQQKILEIR